jgi:phosphatidylserine/phosphatidylglycerophosphate/cardiolipin synthase-like enzyme
MKLKLPTLPVAAGLLWLSIAAIASDSARHEHAFPATGTIQVAFTPDENAIALIVEALREARKSVLVQAFSFTSNEIAFALIEAKRRGLEVRVLADGQQTIKLESSRIGLLAGAGVPVWLDEQHQSAHNKVMVLDAETGHPTIITGSMNFTYAGQFKNAENLLIIRNDPRLTERYAANWQRHKAHSRPYHR